MFLYFISRNPDLLIVKCTLVQQLPELKQKSSNVTVFKYFLAVV